MDNYFYSGAQFATEPKNLTYDDYSRHHKELNSMKHTPAPQWNPKHYKQDISNVRKWEEEKHVKKPRKKTRAELIAEMLLEEELWNS